MVNGFIVDYEAAERSEREEKQKRNAATTLYCINERDVCESFERMRMKRQGKYHDYQEEGFKQRYSDFMSLSYRSLWEDAEEYPNVKVISFAENHPISAYVLQKYYPKLEKIEIRFGEENDPDTFVKTVSAEEFKDFFSVSYLIGINATHRDFPHAERVKLYKKVPYDRRRYPNIIPIHTLKDFAGGSCFLRSGFDDPFRSRSRERTPEFGKVEIASEIMRPAKDFFQK